MGDERGDDAADRRRADVDSSARIGVAAALTLVLVVLLVLDVAVPDYDISPGILLLGPDAQAEQQTRAIERWGLLDTGDAWEVAHSGRTIASTGPWAEMLAGAGEDWEVLVVGYVSRFARDLRTAAMPVPSTPEAR
jgi:hypothetical protein